MSYTTKEGSQRPADPIASGPALSTASAESRAALEPIDDGLFTVGPEGPHLIASRCLACGTLSFPAQSSCPRCTVADVQQQLLSTRGTLWSWTVQTVRPKSPPYAGNDDERSFIPFGVGYVELEDELRVESRLSVADPARLRIGMAMELVVEPFDRAGGLPVLLYSFRPVDEDRR
jgi:uncharacterized protein